MMPPSMPSMPSMPHQSMQQQAMPSMQPQMRGPTNVDDILKELASERVENISTISESEISDMMSDEQKFVTNIKPSGGRRTLNL